MKPVKPDIQFIVSIVRNAAKDEVTPRGVLRLHSPMRHTSAPAAKARPSLERNAALLDKLALPKSAAGLAVLAAMVAERLTLDPVTAKAIKNAAAKCKDDPAAARIAAKALADGLDMNGAEFEAMLGVLANGNASSDAHSGREHGQPEEKPSERQLAQSLKKAVSAALCDPRFASFCRLPAENSGWVCLPFDIEYSSERFYGFMRLWYDAASRRASRLQADIRGAFGRRLLDVGASGQAHIAYYTDSAAEQALFQRMFSGYAAAHTGSTNEGYSLESALNGSVNETA